MSINLKLSNSLLYSIFRICLTKLDILDTFDEVKIGVEYQLNGKALNYYPSSLFELSSVEVYINS